MCMVKGCSVGSGRSFRQYFFKKSVPKHIIILQNRPTAWACLCPWPGHVPVPRDLGYPYLLVFGRCSYLDLFLYYPVLVYCSLVCSLCRVRVCFLWVCVDSLGVCSYCLHSLYSFSLLAILVVGMLFMGVVQ